MSTDTIIGIIGIGVGAISVIFSWNAWKAARKASDVAEETQRKIGSVRFAEEVDKLRQKIQILLAAVRSENWMYASDKSSEVISAYNELVSRFDPLPESVKDMEFLKHRTQFDSIARTCNMLHAGQARSITNLVAEIDGEIAFLSDAVGRSGKELENKIVQRR